MKKEYIVIYFGEDGIIVTPHDHVEVTELLAQLAEERSGENPFVDGTAKYYSTDGGEYPLYKYMIIKGKVLVPQPVKTVMEYQLP